MVITCDEARRRLKALESTIASLEARRGALSSGDAALLGQYRFRHNRIRFLLAVREVEAAKKVVSLDMWRNGYEVPKVAQVAVMIR